MCGHMLHAHVVNNALVHNMIVPLLYEMLLYQPYSEHLFFRGYQRIILVPKGQD